MEKQIKLLDGLGKNLGLDLVLDENNQCTLLLDDQLILSIKAVDNHFVLYGMLGEFPEDESSAFWKKLLELNFLLGEEGTGSIAFDTTTDVVMLIRYVYSYDMTVTVFEKLIGNFASTLEGLIPLLAEKNDISLNSLDISSEYSKYGKA